jgi:hypothetical protein
MDNHKRRHAPLHSLHRAVAAALVWAGVLQAEAETNTLSRRVRHWRQDGTVQTEASGETAGGKTWQRNAVTTVERNDSGSSWHTDGTFSGGDGKSGSYSTDGQAVHNEDGSVTITKDKEVTTASGETLDIEKVSTLQHTDGGTKWDSVRTVTSESGKTATTTASGSSTRTEEGRAWNVDRSTTTGKGQTSSSSTAGQSWKNDDGSAGWSSSTSGQGTRGRDVSTEASGTRTRDGGSVTHQRTRSGGKAKK